VKDWIFQVICDVDDIQVFLSTFRWRGISCLARRQTQYRVWLSNAQKVNLLCLKSVCLGKQHILMFFSCSV